MSIHFTCEQCGHVFEVGDGVGGRHGRCRHCGHQVVVPPADAPPDAPADDALRMKPMPDAAERGPTHLLDAPPPLSLRAAETKDAAWPSAVSREAADERLRKGGRPNYDLGRPFDGGTGRRRSGPPPWWLNFPSLTARLVARLLRKSRDVLYYVSLASLVLILYGFLFKVKMLLHAGAVVIVTSNISMFCVGAAYLVTLPFKDGLRYGLGCVLVPFYAVYYWATRWHRMRVAVVNTAAAFIPMFLVALAYFFYKEAPRIEHEVERLAPRVEAEADKVLRKAEHAARP